MRMTVKEAAAACGGTLLGGDPDAVLTSASTDSREIGPGALFVPIAGERTDAHRFIGRAFAAGAAAALTQ
ncbi:MAG TPA: UDP-N-acetylmuramoyl-tripeptide--D-alanyl-D-alanine ligase, partial [Ruminococcaceae bacterium]|nr:UDP-N-acetylmuramoyl-tripeptide--D-alanyl-D-alanine ligase [Oscillospiraceae bacterium]